MEIVEPKYFMMNCKFIGNGLSYEDYLIEVLNWSQFFRIKSSDKSEYVLQKSQSFGEADAYSSEYQIDFKLLINEDMMRGLNKNRPTVNKQYISQGIIIVNDNPNPTPIPTKNILLDILSISKENILNNKYSSKTAKHFVENLEKNKNLFLYYPYEYSGEKPFSAKAFARILTDFFSVPLTYREQNYPEFDTYICIKVNELFLIFEWTNGQFVYRDSVNELLCSTYRDYKMYSFF